MPTNYKLKDFRLLVQRNVFVDANVLIYLFWPTGQFYYENNYATVYKNLLKQGTKLYVDFIVISEVVNRVMKIEYNKTKSNSNIGFKYFRNSQVGKEAINDIYLIVKNTILNNFNIIGKVFSKSEIENLLFVAELDFVDKAIVSICSDNSLVLLTNDKDFKNSEIDILTCNPNILT